MPGIAYISEYLQRKAYMLLGQIFAISVASNLFYLALVLSGPSVVSRKFNLSLKNNVSLRLVISVLLTLTTVHSLLPRHSYRNAHLLCGWHSYPGHHSCHWIPTGFSHPAQPSIGWNVIWTCPSLVAWIYCWATFLRESRITIRHVHISSVFDVVYMRCSQERMLSKGMRSVRIEDEKNKIRSLS